ncbi:DUF4097 family beta strand repeat-containing protein [Actinoplanes sp. KI2]|uniref:DUF4097 family beta strand repeat-containing protein n=1 Tax=Actinoplanes sp. KI2 TaxID=2983315 RepID=UPI0021D5BD0C|nr:DUF4097 family beta strand repeat-containing protein [Actinoplanes sp. KI2]MCU7722630.1 DUF4097 family beta strand repeat-containing protein [Actinoplanes sp. KI2]
MPTFDTPESVTVTLEVGVAEVRITAGERADTVVDVRPGDDTDESDVQAARQVRVELAHGELRIIGPRRTFDFSRKTRAVDVTIELPAGSMVSADIAAGDIRATGRLGQCRLRTGAGHITADEIDGNADVSTGSGRIELGGVAGTVAIKNSNGATTVSSAGGDLRVRNANGDITVGRAGAGVDAKTSNGTIRIGAVVRGSVVLVTPAGDLDVGIAEGTAAWLEVKTGFGHVRNLLENATGPEEAAETVEVRARTSYGDITIRRA